MVRVDTGPDIDCQVELLQRAGMVEKRGKVAIINVAAMDRSAHSQSAPTIFRKPGVDDHDSAGMAARHRPSLVALILRPCVTLP
jgi:hypothetical protein